MPIVKYTIIRFLLFGIPFILCLYLKLGIIASAIIAALVSLALSYVWLGNSRDDIVQWVGQKKKNTARKISDGNDAEDAQLSPKAESSKNSSKEKK